ncbi:MAG: RNA polymerase subunit sigma-70 [Bacteroidetes bacterium MedPE-SWsnd-G1]|uniref:RNA polymerase sigma factor n=1 Tax=Urechidicola vernalis TaxID=3075600 RepID=A0ABU2Y8E5_9FLAO|nr:RNA polymerase sigma factor [Urechidicola sp. P050]MDT0554111.1 RNA polymerase sigma factor [Urechidicola sp. P050]OIQ36690.1 MAG: RNA polymerase subunit sigma-70 [Bacteroidetes bacterium MedPE-SWsnd-G1]
MKIIQLYKNETSLIKGALKNNRDAQHTLFELHSPKMLSVCRYYIKDLQHAEEAMLNGFYKVFTKLKSFNQEGSFEGWIRKIMVRESISMLRKLKKVEFPQEEIIVNETYNNINIAIDVAQIQQLIDGLPEGYRIVFVMYAIEGYKHAEIAKELQISEGTSKSQLFKARKLLQQQMNQLNRESHVANKI